MASASSILNRIYTISAVGTVIIGLIALVAGVSTAVVEPIVLLGAMVIFYVDIYWLFGGSGAY